MSWRQVPPALSPVSLTGVAAGIAATLGLRDGDRESAIDALRARYGASDVLLTDSGTSALVLAMRRHARHNGVVALPAYGCPDLVSAAVGAGVRVRLYDLDPATLSPDLDSLRATIVRGVDAIVVAHFYGYPADLREVRRMADAGAIPIIEDAAQGAGGRLDGVVLGSIGETVVLSFGRGKGTTGGSGGALLTRGGALPLLDDEMTSGVAASGATGHEIITLSAQWLFARPSLYRVPASIPALKLGESVYHPAHEPRRMTATATAIMLDALRLDAAELHARHQTAAALLAEVETSSRIRPVRPIAGGESGYLRFVVLDVDGRAAPRPQLGAIRGYPKTLDDYAAIAPVLLAGERAGPGAKQLRDRAFTLPTHSRVHAPDVSALAGWLRSPGDPHRRAP